MIGPRNPSSFSWPTKMARFSTAALLILIGLGLLPRSAAAQQKIITVEGITEYRLDNGLQVLIFPDSSKPTFTVNVTYLVGSRHEGRGETGMAHLLEHMVFKGTPTYDNIWGALEDHGARFNGSTWVDRTNYFETLPSNDENLNFALRMEADRMVNSKILAEDLAKEMTVVRNEFEMGENYPTGVLSERMMSAAYLWHNYGKSTIGNRSDIERVPVENLRKFYKKYYQPDNAMLVVAGQFDVEKTLGLINKYFGAIPKPTRTLDSTYTEEPPQDGAKLVTLRRVGDVAVAGLIYHMPAALHPDFPAAQILEDVMTTEPSGRLYKALVEPGHASSIHGAAYAWAEPGIMEIMAEVRLDKDPQFVLDKMQEIMEGVAQANITDKEVERIKTRRLKNIKMALASSGRIGVRLSEWAALGDWRTFFIHRDRIKKVTTEDVRRVAAEYLVASNRTAGLYLPDKSPVRAEIPTTPNVEDIVRGYKGTETIQMGEAFAATPENIENRTKRSTLRNGMKVALLSKETRGDKVYASFQFHFGTEEALTGRTAALDLIPTMMMRGTTKRNYEQLRDEIDRLQSRINVSGSAGGFSGFIESDRANLVAAIELLGEILQKPVFSHDEFEIVQKQKLTRLEEGLSDPQTLGFKALTRSMNPWPKSSIHYVPTVKEDIERVNSVSLGTVKDLYTKHYGGSNMEVSVVGDFDEAQIKTTLENVFGSWKSPSRYVRIAKPHRDIKASSETILTPDKKMAIVGTGVGFAMRDDDPDAPALRFSSYILGQSAKSRLLNRLRHKGGLSYGAGAFLRSSSQDKRTALIGYAICAPQNAVKAQDAMREEIQKWIAEGLTEEEMTDGKKSYALKFQNDLANDQTVVRMLVSGLEIDRTLEFDAKMQARIQKLTKSDIQRVLKKRMSAAPFVEIKAGDLEKKNSD